jgi:WD40-like Beta Propeller Repeat
MGWIAGLITAAAMAAGATHYLSRPPAIGEEVRFEVATPPTADPTAFAISPDGKKLAFEATSDGKSRLWLRSLDAVQARPLAGTEKATSPFWLPDSRVAGFSADGRVKGVNIDTGTVQPLAGAGAWNQDGTILFSRRGGGAADAQRAALHGVSGRSALSHANAERSHAPSHGYSEFEAESLTLRSLGERRPFAEHDVEGDAVCSRNSARLVSLSCRVLGQEDMPWAESHLAPTLELDLAFTAQGHHDLPARRRMPVEIVGGRRVPELHARHGDRCRGFASTVARLQRNRGFFHFCFAVRSCVDTRDLYRRASLGEERIGPFTPATNASVGIQPSIRTPPISFFIGASRL